MRSETYCFRSKPGARMYTVIMRNSIDNSTCDYSRRSPTRARGRFYKLTSMIAASVVLFCAAGSAQEKGKIVEEVIARVNNDAITRGDLEHSRVQMASEVEQECT